MYFLDSYRQQAIADAARNPVVPKPVDGYWASFTHSLDSFAKSQFDFYGYNNRANAWDNELQRFIDHGGSVQENTPQQRKEMESNPALYGGDFGWIRYQVDRFNRENPDRPFELPSNDDMERRALAYARSAVAADTARQTSQTSFMGSLGSFTGDAAGQLLQPSNIVAFSLLGAGPGAGYLRMAASDFLAGAVGQLGNEALTYSDRRMLNPEYGLSDMAGNAVEAGAYGAAFGLGQRLLVDGAKAGLRGSVGLWRGMRDSGAPVPRETRDAGNVVEHAANIEASNPFPQHGLAGENAHVEAMQGAYQRALQGKPFEIPAATDVVGRETPAQTVERRLRQDHAEVMDRLDVLQSQRDMNADRLDDLNRTLASPEHSATRRQIIAVEEATAKAERLEAARDKAKSEKQRAKLDEQAQAARAKVAELEAMIEPEAGERLAFTERERRMRAEALQAVEDQLAEQKKTVDRLKAEALDRYWAEAREAPADAPKPEMAPEHRAEVDRLRAAIDEGKVPPGADLEADLVRAQEVVKAADEKGQAVGAYLAGLDHVDRVNSRVRALIGLMHEESTLATRVTPKEFGRRLQSLVDELTGERTAPGGKGAPRAAAGQGEARPVVPTDKAGEPATVAQIAKEATSPQAMEAQAMEAYRLLEQNPDFEISTIGPDGTLQKRRLADVLEEHEQDLAAANDLKACALGTEAAE